MCQPGRVTDYRFPIICQPLRTSPRVVYTDHRRFGLMILVPTADVEMKLKSAGDLGPEPLDDSFTPALLVFAALLVAMVLSRIF